MTIPIATITPPGISNRSPIKESFKNSSKGRLGFLGTTSGPVVSVEDQRELSYKPQKSMTAEEHKSTATSHDSSVKTGTSSAMDLYSIQFNVVPL